MKLKFTFTSDPRRLAEVRSCVRSFLTKCGFDECSIELLVLGLDEACTNVILHAYSGQDENGQVFDYVKYEPRRRGTRLVLEKKFAEDSRIYSRR